METINTQVGAEANSGLARRGNKQSFRDSLDQRRGLVIMVVVVAAATAVALGVHWTTVADLPPLLFTLPCAAMMLACLRSRNDAQQPDAAQASAQNGS